MFYLVDWGNRTFGDGHKTLASAVKEFDNVSAEKLKTKEEFHMAVVEFKYDIGDNGVPQYSILRHFIKVPK